MVRYPPDPLSVSSFCRGRALASLIQHLYPAPTSGVSEPRGSLRSGRQDGRVLVWVDEGRTEGGREAQVDREVLLEAKDETIRTLREQLDAERRANEENRRLLATLIQRVPELEAPPARSP